MVGQVVLRELTDEAFSVWSRMRQDLWDDCDNERNASVASQ